MVVMSVTMHRALNERVPQPDESGHLPKADLTDNHFEPR